MSKFTDEILKEHSEWSLKRILAVIFSIIIIVHSLLMISTIFTGEEIPGGHELLLGELISFVTLLLGLSVINKHQALRKTTNKAESEDP